MEKPPIDSADSRAEAYDAEGNARMTFTMPDDSTFYGTEKEYKQALQDYRENRG